MLSNKEIEQKAKDHVKSIYKNTKEATKGSGYDFTIGNRIVEVKGTTKSNPNQNIFLSRQPEYDAFIKYKERYWLFRVVNVGKPDIDLKEIPAKDLEVKPDPRWRVKIIS